MHYTQFARWERVYSYAMEYAKAREKETRREEKYVINEKTTASKHLFCWLTN